MSRYLSASLLTVLGAALTAPLARAQSDPAQQVLRACYIPQVGLVYRIGEPGLPQNCLSSNHVEFSWNAQGPKGDKGDKGDPGTLALAGQKCPLGQFMTGFDAAGQIACGAPPVGGGSFYDGTWTISPVIAITCPLPTGPVVLNVASAQTQVTAQDRMLFTAYATFASTTVPATVELGLAPDGSFSGSGSFLNGGGKGTATVEGAFDGADAFSARIQITLTVTTGTTQAECDAVDAMVQGTRS